jgi:hypothetical protein
MSETVHYKGKIKLVEKLPNETLEEQCERILKKHGYDKLHEWCDSYEDMVFDELYEKYVIVDDDVYEVLVLDDIGTEYDIYHAHRNNDGTIDYEVMYYNGGCYFDEAIDTALLNMDCEVVK